MRCTSRHLLLFLLRRSRLRATESSAMKLIDLLLINEWLEPLSVDWWFRSTGPQIKPRNDAAKCNTFIILIIFCCSKAREILHRKRLSFRLIAQPVWTPRYRALRLWWRRRRWRRQQHKANDFQNIATTKAIVMRYTKPIHLHL